ncbi:MAG TPA: hypothetical protein DHV59_06030 [Oxalobacteraceae bacterium]|nr:hypothetical protein [Oxalobacteraceae bacterium]
MKVSFLYEEKRFALCEAVKSMVRSGIPAGAPVGEFTIPPMQKNTEAACIHWHSNDRTIAFKNASIFRPGFWTVSVKPDG